MNIVEISPQQTLCEELKKYDVEVTPPVVSMIPRLTIEATDLGPKTTIEESK